MRSHVFEEKGQWVYSQQGPLFGSPFAALTPFYFLKQALLI
jgi:hypothetical protein